MQIIFNQALFWISIISILVIGVFFKDKVKSFKDFAVGQKKFSSNFLIATTIATLIGSGSLIGKTQALYQEGIVLLLASLGSPIGTFLMSGWILPKFQKYYSCISSPEIIGKIYGNKARIISAISSIIFCIGVTAAQIKGLSYVLENIFYFQSNYVLIISFLIIIGYTMFGGITSVVRTDVVQFIVFIIIIPAVVLYIISSYGGIGNILNLVPKAKLSMDFSIVTFGGMFLYYFFPELGPSYIQRILISKDHHTNINIAYSYAICYSLILALSSLVAFIAIYQFPNLSSHKAFFVVVKTSLSNYPFVFGVLGVALLALIVSTADSLINTSSTILVNDLNLFTKVKNKELVYVRIWTFFSGIFSLLISLYSNSIFEIIMFFVQYEFLITSLPLLLGILFKVGTKSIYFYSVGIGSVIQTVSHLYTSSIPHSGFLLSFIVFSFVYFFMLWLKNSLPHHKVINFGINAERMVNYTGISRKNFHFLLISIFLLWQIFLFNSKYNLLIQLNYITIVLLFFQLYIVVFKDYKRKNDIALILFVWLGIFYMPSIIYLLNEVNFFFFGTLLCLVIISVSIFDWRFLSFSSITAIFFSFISVKFFKDAQHVVMYEHLYNLLIFLGIFLIILFTIVKKKQNELINDKQKISILKDRVIIEKLGKNYLKLYQKFLCLKYESEEKKHVLIKSEEFIEDLKIFFCFKVGDIEKIKIKSDIEQNFLISCAEYIFYQIIFSISNLILNSNLNNVHINLTKESNNIIIEIIFQKRGIKILQSMEYLSSDKEDLFFLNWQKTKVLLVETGVHVLENTKGVRLIINSNTEKVKNKVVFLK
jgi:Na+/proline symporter